MITNAVYEMSRYTLEQRWEILNNYFQNGESSIESPRRLLSKFGKKEAPSRQYVDKFVKCVRETGSLLEKKYTFSYSYCAHPRKHYCCRKINQAPQLVIVLRN